MSERESIYNHPALEGKKRAKFPNHILIVPDGNYTYAKNAGISKTEGHFKGLQNSVEISRALRDVEEISTVSFWVLSSKNLDQRPKNETQTIMEMVTSRLEDPTIMQDFMDSEVRFVHLGNTQRLSSHLKKALSETTQKTSENKKHTLALLIDYGWEGYELPQIIEQARNLRLYDPRSSEELATKLPSYKTLPPVDLMIRSKAKLLQISGIGPIVDEAVLEFIEKPWPEVTVDDVLNAIGKFAGGEERNFGGRSENT